MQKILVLGVSGMIGHQFFKYFSAKTDYEVSGTIRSLTNLSKVFSPKEQKHIQSGVDATNFDSIMNVFLKFKPDIVINCIGIIKQLSDANNHYDSIYINAFFPHRLAKLCSISNVRLIHLSTDCVFDGKSGNYFETENANATDLYGKTKYLGEVDYPHAITIRKSAIGHELNSNVGLLDWFLSQSGNTKGYSNAIFSGITTLELAKIIDNYIIPNSNLHGLYHISAQPINKYELLKMIAEVYKKQIEIIPYAEFKINRSLNSDKFQTATGFKPKSWQIMLEEMHTDLGTRAYFKKL